MSDAEKQYEVEPTAEKIKTVEALADQLSRSTGAILLDYRGLSVAQMTQLRRKLDDSDADFQVVKNTLLRIAAKAADKDFGDMLEGPSAVAILYGDPVGPAKIFTDFITEIRNPNITLKGGVLDSKPISVKQVEALGKIPSKEVLIAQMLGGFQAPISNFVGTLSGVLSSFVFTLQAISDQKGGAATA
jgi:large subunit ribosomal protein L10